MLCNKWGFYIRQKETKVYMFHQRATLFLGRIKCLEGGIILNIERQDETAVVSPRTSIDIRNSDYFKEILIELYAEGYKNIDLNFENIDGIDASGIGKLLLLQKKLKEKGGRLRIFNIENKYVRNIFSIIYIDNILDIEE